MIDAIVVILQKKYQYIIFSLLSTFLAYLLIGSVQFASQDGGMYMFNGSNYVMYAWNEGSGLGQSLGHHGAHFILHFFRQLFGPNIYSYQLVFYACLFFTIFLGLHYIILFLVKRFKINISQGCLLLISCIVGGLYIFNPLNVTYRLATTNTNAYFFYVLPMLTAGMLYFLEKISIKRGVLLAILITVYNFVALDVPAYFGFILFAALLSIFFIKDKKKILVIIITVVFALLLNLYWVVNFLYLGKDALANGIAIVNPIGNIEYLASIVKEYHLLLLYPSEHWNMVHLADNFYVSNIILGIWGIFIVLTLLLGLLYLPRRYFALGIGVYLIFFELCRPTGVLSLLLVKYSEKFPLLALYRTAHEKLNYFLIILFCLLVLYLLLQKVLKYRKLYITIVLGIILMNIIPFLRTSLYDISTPNGPVSTRFSLPKQYLSQDFQKLAELDSYGRLLILPLYKVDRVLTTYGYNGLDPYVEFLDTPFLGNFAQNSPVSMGLLKMLDSGDFPSAKSMLKNLGINYIVLRPDSGDIRSLDYNSNASNVNLQKDFVNMGGIIFHQKIGDFIIYKTNDYGISQIQGTGSIQKINPTQYHLTTTLKSKQDFKFLQSYHSQWKLYLEPYTPLDCRSGATVHSGTTMESEIGTGAKSSASSVGTSFAKEATQIYLSQRGDTLASIARSQTGMTLTGIIALNPGVTQSVLKQGTEIVVSTSEQNPPNPLSQGGDGTTEQTGTGESYHVTECPSENRFYAGGELSRLWEKPIFDDTHRMVYDYANQWTIDPEYIRANYPREYYRENPDGTIDVRMTMYFRPQSYFYLGLIISGLTLLGCVSYLVVSGVRGRRREAKMIDGSAEH